MSCSRAASGGRWAVAAASRAWPIACARTWRGRSRPGSEASDGPCSPASSSARTRASPKGCATASARRVSTTCSPSRARTSCSSRRGMLGLAWLIGLPRWLGQLGALAAIAGYVAAVGWQPSVVRAGVAGALASLAWLAARPRDRWYFLLAGAVVLLAWNPYSLLEPGFQLSFSAVAAIFVAVPALGRRLEGYPVPVRLADVLAVSAACGVVTAPILWLHFGAVPLYSVPANALAWPAVAPLLGTALACTAVHPVFPQLAEALAWVNGWLAAYVAACARLVGGLPGARGDLAARRSRSLGAAGCSRSSRSRGCGGRGAPRAVALGVLSRASPLAGVCGRCGRARAPPPPPTGLRITALDVGQGDAILLQVPRGQRPRRPGPAGGRTSPDSSRASASAGWRRSSSRIRSATTSAAPLACSAGSASTSCSTRASRPRAPTSGRRSRSPGGSGSPVETVAGRANVPARRAAPARALAAPARADRRRPEQLGDRHPRPLRTRWTRC